MRRATPVYLPFYFLVAASAASLAIGCGPTTVDPPPPECGNGMVETGEQCDDGNLVDGDGCDSQCFTEVTGPVCGDGLVEAPEECDDGNTTPGDGCDANCLTEVVAMCGDGIIQIGEQCDPPDGTTCDAMCQVIAAVPFMCPAMPAGTVNCGDLIAVDTTGGPMDPGAHCMGMLPADGPEQVYMLTAAATEAMQITLNNLTADVDLIISTGAMCNTEMCVGASANPNMDPEIAQFMVFAGETYWIVVDNFAATSGSADLEINCPSSATCGDGVIEFGEVCDDGNTMGGDGCSPGCGDEALCVPDAMVGPADLVAMNPTTLAAFTPAANNANTLCAAAVGGNGPETIIEVTMPMGTTDLQLNYDHTGGDILYAVMSDVCLEIGCFDWFGTMSPKAGSTVFPAVSTGAADTTVFLVVESFGGMPPAVNLTLTAM